MNGTKIRIGLVMGSNFNGYPPGGGLPTVEIFLKYAQERPFDVWLFGMSTSRDEPVGKVSKRRIYGRDYPFVPLFYFDAERYANQRPLVPLRIQALMAYLRRRRLVERMKFDLLYLHAPEALPFLWRKHRPVLYHIHGEQEGAARYSRYRLFKTGAFGFFYHLWIRSILERADEFIDIDPMSYERYTGWMPQKRDRFHLLPTAIDVHYFKPIPGFDEQGARRSFGLPQSGKMVLFVGRLSWMKGVDLVLRGFALVASQVPGAFLAIAGIGEERPRLEVLARELGVEGRVFFLGQVPRSPRPDLARLFNCANVSTVGSHSESLALVITEALACGTPVVSTPVGIAPTVIRNGVSGYLLESRDPEEMAGRILQIIRDGECDPNACVAAARDYAETSKEICDVVEKLCPRDTPPATVPAGSSPGGERN